MVLVVVAGADEVGVDRCNRSIAALQGLVVDAELRRSADLAQVAFGLRWYRNAVVLRLRVLVAGVEREFNGGNVVSALILARQVVETAAHFVDTFSKVRKELRRTPIELERIHDRVLANLFGTSPKSDLGGGVVKIDAVNALSCIDECDRLIRKCSHEVAAAEHRPVRSSYDFASELVHPNGFAFMYHFERDGDDGARFWDDGTVGNRERVARSVLRALLILDIFLPLERAFGELVRRAHGAGA